MHISNFIFVSLEYLKGCDKKRRKKHIFKDFEFKILNIKKINFSAKVSYKKKCSLCLLQHNLYFNYEVRINYASASLPISLYIFT